MLERISVPRRAMDFEDYVDILRRNFRWVLGPTFAGLVIATVTAFVMQDTYISAALIRIVPQQISDSLVQNSTSQQIADHINAMAESILSRNTLTNLVNSYHLYSKEVKSEPMEDVLNEMRKAISIKPTLGIADMSNGQRSLPAMQISFKYRERLVAQKVCDELVSRFMSQNTSETIEHTEAANQFMIDETQRARRELDDINQKLSDFRTRNAGRLPEQMELNIQQMNSLSNQETAINAALNRNSEQRMLLESSLRIAKDRLTQIKDVTPQAQARNERVEELNRQIQNLQTNIADLKERYTDINPDLVAARQQLSVLEKTREEALKEKPKDVGADNPAVAREKMDSNSQISAIEAQLKASQMEEQQLQRQLAAIAVQVKAYEGRVQTMPAGEKEYAELMHDRDLAKQKYDELAQKSQRAALSTDLERRKQGETLEVLDSASLPDSPSAPKRPMIIAMGPGIGLALGIILVGIREVKDTSLKNLKDARLYTQLNILGSVPLLENDLIVQRRKQIMWVGWATATVAGLAVMGVTIAHYYLTKA